MGTLKERLQSDLTAAMKSRDELRAATLRMVLSAIRNEEVGGAAARELSDDEVVTVLRRENKKRREAAEAYTAAGRSELADREDAESQVIAGYLPAQLDDAELSTLVAAAISEAQASTPGQMGAVMRLLTPRIAGRAEGGRVAAEVRRQLAQS